MKEIDNLLSKMERQVFKNATKITYNNLRSLGYTDDEILAIMDDYLEHWKVEDRNLMNYHNLYKLWIKEFTKIK